jgi:type I restriction enzyme S subunit
MNTKRAPKVRFKGFTDAWELRKLPEFVNFYSGLTYTPDNVQESGTLVLRSSNVKNGEIIDADNVYVNIDIVNSENVQDGDIIVVIRNGSRALIGKHAQIKGFRSNTVIGAFMTGIRSEHPAFVNALLDTPAFEIEIAKNLGATINQITGYMFSKMEFAIPSSKEQIEIGKFFLNLDNLITLHQRKLDKMKELKKAFLNLIFSQKLRFYGFTESWELRKLGEVAPLRGGYAFQSNQYANEGIPIVRISNILSDGSVGGEFVFHNELKDDEIFMLENGDIVLAMSGATTGKVSILSSEKSCKYYQNQRVGLFSKTATCNYSFVATIVRSEKFLEQLQDVLVAGAQPNVSAKDIDAFDFSVPKNVEEQSQIGNFFRTLDRLITLYQKKIDSSKEMKKILLKNMLI